MSIYDGKIEPLPIQKKTLTEKWKNGELEEGYYYVLVKDYPEIVIDEYATWYDRNGKSKKEFTFGASIEEVLKPVPTLHEYDELQERLKEAEYILDEMGWADRGLIDDYFEKWGGK